MKKSLFLTTTLMVVMLIVALSTATFAWFSASNAVNVSTISFTASSKDGQSELHISWNNDLDDTSVEIAFGNFEDMDPMVPKALPRIAAEGVAATTYTEFTEGNFFTASQSDGDEPIFTGRVAPVQPTLCTSEEGQGTFYLINSNPNLAISAKMEYEIDGDLKGALCLAVFADGELAGIVTAGESVNYGAITLGAPISSLPSATDPVRASGQLRIRVPAGTAVPVRLVAWYCGNDLDNSGKMQSSQLKSIKFVGEYV